MRTIAIRHLVWISGGWSQEPRRVPFREAGRGKAHSYQRPTARRRLHYGSWRL